jgi:hypothetical protein
MLTDLQALGLFLVIVGAYALLVWVVSRFMRGATKGRDTH